MKRPVSESGAFDIAVVEPPRQITLQVRRQPRFGTPAPEALVDKRQAYPAGPSSRAVQLALHRSEGPGATTIRLSLAQLSDLANNACQPCKYK